MDNINQPIDKDTICDCYRRDQCHSLSNEYCAIQKFIWSRNSMNEDLKQINGWTVDGSFYDSLGHLSLRMIDNDGEHRTFSVASFRLNPKLVEHFIGPPHKK